ncbi:MAG: hypothetical protein ACREOZ_03075, partial [Gloeomargaritales cyanobacterium]
SSGGGGESLDKNFSKVEWNKLSFDQRAQVKQARENKRKRSISSLSNETTTESDNQSVNSQATDNAGDQFGRHAHFQH